MRGEYAEEDYLQLSGLQHFAFCRRQWALIHVEGLWAQSDRTLLGDFFHERAHDAALDALSGATVLSRGMPVHSRALGLTGTCDVVEFHPDPAGVALAGRDGLYRPYPIEYKRGRPKQGDCDRLQLCAQALCLEEMLFVEAPEGALYYGETRRRERVRLDGELRGEVRHMLEEMHQLMERAHTPRPKRAKACSACSLRDLCLPGLDKRPSVSAYIRGKLEADE